MMPNMDSMVDELVLIKVAEERERKPWKFPKSKEWGQLGKNVLTYGAGVGAGTGLGYALRKKVLPKMLPNMGAKGLAALSYGGGALLGLAGAAALRQAMRATEAKRE